LNEKIGEIRQTSPFQGDEEIRSENKPTEACARVAEGHKSDAGVCFRAKTRILDVEI